MLPKPKVHFRNKSSLDINASESKNMTLTMKTPIEKNRIEGQLKLENSLHNPQDKLNTPDSQQKSKSNEEEIMTVVQNNDNKEVDTSSHSQSNSNFDGITELATHETNIYDQYS